jgi:hypothetical protein
LTDVSNSQRGGEAAFKGLGYQTNFIAYLSLEMLLEKRPIKRIICEHKDDIEVEVDSELINYQVASASGSTLRKPKIIKSIRSFSSIESKKTKETYNRYVLVPNANIRNIKEDMVERPFKELDSNIKKEIESMISEKELFEKIYFLKGPTSREILGSTIEHLLEALKDEDYNYDLRGIKRHLLYHINAMCPGPIGLVESKIMKEYEENDYRLKHKTIDLKTIHKIIEQHKKPSTKPALQRVSQSLTLRYTIRSHLSKEQLRDIHDLINEYNDFSEENELRHTYILKFNELSRSLSLYRDKIFLDFLREQFESSRNKHIILECSFILHNLIIASKEEHELHFLQYVNKVYFPLFKKNLESRNEIYEYSISKIEQIIKELKDLIPEDEICELYWKRMVSIIQNIKKTGVTDNTLWNCIIMLNQCKIKTKWRKWLIRKDKFSDIKNAVFKELSSSKLIS